MADETGEDGGQAMPSSVQYNIGGGSPHCYLGAAAVCRATSKKGSVTLFSLVFLCLIFILQYIDCPMQCYVQCSCGTLKHSIYLNYAVMDFEGSVLLINNKTKQKKVVSNGSRGRSVKFAKLNEVTSLGSAWGRAE